FGRMDFLGSHQVKAGFNYAHSSYDGTIHYLPAEIMGVSGATVQRIDFGPTAKFNVGQDETAWFVADKWTPVTRLAVDLGPRGDHGSITESTNVAPRAGVAYALTQDSKTVIKAGAGLFYDRVMLNAPVYTQFPNRVVTTADGSISYRNTLGGPI